MKVRLTRKYAERLDGVDLSGWAVGDTMDLPPREARLLLAEQWAAPERRERTEPTAYRRRSSDYR